eukprot:5011714-Prymnesium_polylepis.1
MPASALRAAMPASALPRRWSACRVSRRAGRREFAGLGDSRAIREPGLTAAGRLLGHAIAEGFDLRLRCVAQLQLGRERLPQLRERLPRGGQLVAALGGELLLGVELPLQDRDAREEQLPLARAKSVGLAHVLLVLFFGDRRRGRLERRRERHLKAAALPHEAGHRATTAAKGPSAWPVKLGHVP